MLGMLAKQAFLDIMKIFEPCSEDFNTHLWGFQGDRWETFMFTVNLGM